MQFVVSRIYNTLNDVVNRIQQLPKGNSQKIYLVDDDAALQALYNELTSCSTSIIPSGTYQGAWRQLQDGTIIGLCNSSSSGGRTIDIIGADYKVHIK